jgi:hypothetical protein
MVVVKEKCHHEYSLEDSGLDIHLLSEGNDHGRGLAHLPQRCSHFLLVEVVRNSGEEVVAKLRKIEGDPINTQHGRRRRGRRRS